MYLEGNAVALRYSMGVEMDILLCSFDDILG